MFQGDVSFPLPYAGFVYACILIIYNATYEYFQIFHTKKIIKITILKIKTVKIMIKSPNS